MTDPASAPRLPVRGYQFGQRQPPLSVAIKAILDRYPDGQIFKEIIQNADDAGATTVHFYLDSRQHGTGSLVEPALARFQGPALLAYNNAEFTDDDWEGIQNLQRSVKAEDPFKVGKFGIGFNSVYHITDLPVIVSGQKLAYLEPQEQVWRGESGIYFHVPDLQQFPDTLAPFNNICGFSASSGNIPASFFRFALRDTPSELSENLYNVERLRKLLEALMEEAKFLLLFLKSVDTIQVIEISQHGRQATVFQVEIEEKSEIQQKRQQFMRQLHSAYSIQSYSISTHIDFTASFHVKITRGYDTTRVHYLVASRVGSDCQDVLRAAAEQHVFPWVGVAVELQGSLVGSSMDPSSSYPGGGRISCFLPMSPEASSPLPPHVHVHGTFGLNDDRRTLKWPSGERRNDPTAEWNILLVKELLPQCYHRLLLRHAIALLTPAQFYEAWPDVDTVRSTPWKALLLPLFRILLGQPVLWTEKTEALQCVGEWLRPGEATFIPKGCKLPSVVHNALSSCNVKLVTIPDKIWKALAFSGTSVQEVSPSLARARLKLKPSSYSSIDSVGKLELLRYLLSDNTYRELPGLVLLPLTNGSFVAFESPGRYYQVYRYLCSSECPRHLLPNLDERLVDTSNNDDLHSSLLQVANSNCTQLQMLTASTVAQLLPESMPAEWRGQQVVSLPHYSFPTDWFRKFWDWIQGKSLDTFRGQLVVPCSQSSQTSHIHSSFQVTRLIADSSTVYIPARATCSPTLMSALERLQVRCSKVSDFRYLNHWQITLYLNEFTPNGILDAISHSGANPQLVSFTANEASTLREILSQSGSYLPPRLQILQKLSIFATAKNSCSNLYSVIQVRQESCLRRAIMEPQNFIIEGRQLPSNLILFLRQEYSQIRLLQHFGSLVSSPDNTDFLLEFLFPLVRQRSIPDYLLDGLMQKVLDYLPYLIPQYHHTQSSERLKSSLQNLPFLKTATGPQKCPSELFDPADSQLSQLFEGESVFPIHPFNQPQYLTQLRRCGLRTTATPQEIVNIANSIATPQATSYPQKVSSVRLSRAKAVLVYLSECDSLFMSTSVTLPHFRGRFTFSSALKYLATNRNWLPVSQSPPTDYPSCLSWKGSPYNSHLVSLNNSVSVLSTDSSSELPFVVGSQMYLVEHSLPSQVVSHCFPSGGIPAKHILAHFQEVIDNHQNISSEKMDQITRLLYQMLLTYEQQGMQSQLKTLHSFHKWIWLRRYQSFVSPSVIAVRQNATFRQNLEPFLIILPDDLTPYADLFKAFGVTEKVTQSQIVSVLGMIKDRVSTELRAADAWQMVMSILNWLTNSGDTDVELSCNDTTLYVPTESESEYPELVEASEVNYTDSDYLKNYLASSDSEESYIFVHHSIRPEMAHHLGLTPLSQYLEISEDTFEDVGQHEPLTTRLRNILQDYKDRVTIIKELLQNADDAEASVVNICYDSRTHSIPQKHLIYSGMAECHGPALVVHNDASFSDEDFKNITKLAAGTKQDEPLKIGKFGIGFCSVYHITDVPSFVSRDFLYIFDPNLKFLRQEIKNPARPGKKLRFTDKIVASSKQLVPYASLYDFNPKKPYNGTMFRLPFRTSPSDISHNIYNEDTIRALLTDVTKCGPELLLFLRNVKQITFSRIDPGDNTPKLLLSITKEDGATVSTDSRCLAQMCTTTLNSKAQVHKQHWLVSSYSDTVMFRESEKYATASVVCLLESSGKPHSGYTPKCVEGEVFCFLPLAVHTGLPVHVSSNFAVMKDRTGIKSSDDTESSDKSQWNVCLMRQVIPVAYHMLIMALQQMCAEGKIRSETYQFFSLWPLKHSLKSHNPWDDLIEPLYQLISSDNSKLFYSSYTTEWIPMKQCKFLAPAICKSYKESTPKCVLEVVKYFDLPVVNLPFSYQEHLPKEARLECTISDKDFIQQFFENIDSLKDCQTTRNEVLLHLLEMFTIATAEQKDYLKHHLSSSKCIPCTPDGNQLKECSKVIDKWSLFAGLYGPEDGVFPIGEFCVNELVRSSLRLLGINSDSLPWKMLAERARSVQFLDKHEALKRAKLIIQCIEKNLAALTSETVDPEANELAEIPFLPVMQKPSDYPLKWFGQDSDLLSGKELFTAKPDKNVFLVGSQTPFVSEAEPEHGGCGVIPTSVQTCLQLQSSPTTEFVLKQLCLMAEVFKEACQTRGLSTHLSGWITDGSHLVYDFFETKLSSLQCSAEELHQLQHIPCVWTGSEFVSPAVVAVNWEHNGPYLFSVPQSLKQKRNLMAALGIQTTFSAEYLFGALEKMKYDFGSEVVSNSKHQTIVPVLVQQLAEAPELPEGITCYLPDTSFIMHKAEELAYNDAPWCKLEKEWKLVHTSIPRDAALKLGVKPVRSRLLGMHESSKQHFEGVEFGQKERLTQRIKNILREYPFDVTVMKELLQNADDAKATKIYIILDKRTHRAKQLPSNEWKDLQGPALLVWNDSIFTEDDLSGIQRLGLGNKRSDAESIGLYGIGFNVVYHLTDCPSFITNGSTFCVLDPHCRYVPGANELMPGRRYDNLDETFWSNWRDLRSAYLQNKFPGCPSEVKGGTLFRFPLRSTKELVQQSKIVDESWVSSDQSSPMSARKMQEKLNEWAPNIEKALLFLNHITELKFFIITESRTESRMQLTHCLKVILDDDTKASRALLHDKIKAFEDTKGEPQIVHYALTITKESSPSRRAESQRWLIQQGVGDVDNPDQHWKHSPQVKPRHGLAAPLEGHGRIGLRGSVFCFLPLPLVSNLPVHVNGSFMLNAARSNLWSSEKSNDRTKWNEKLIEAIASSYARFLVTARDFYVFKSGGSDQQLQRYYNNFPVWLINDEKQPQGLFKTLAKEVYEKLSKQNAHILAMMIKLHPTKHFKTPPPIDEACVIEWHPLQNDTHPSKQAFFFWQATTPRETTQASIQKADTRGETTQASIQKADTRGETAQAATQKADTRGETTQASIQKADTRGETAQAATQKAKIPKETAQAAIQKAKIPKETAQAAIQKAKIPAQAVIQKAKIPKETAQAEIQKAKIPKETAQAATEKADTSKETVLATIFEKIGMHITAAPYRIRKHFKDIGIELHTISPSSVFQYYNDYFSNMHHFPCPIQTSAFQLVATFRKFTRYLLRKCEESPGYYEFPKSPFGIPLLLTADEQLQKFDEQNKVLNSAFASLFPESTGMFLHPELLDMNYVPTYFIEPSENNRDLIHGILSSLLPPSLCAERVDNANECIIRTATLELLWKCLAKDSVFLQHLHQIVEKWALLLSTDNQLFSVKSQCQLLPIIPPRPEEEHYEYYQQVFDILKWFKVPELNTAVVPTRCERLYPEHSEPASVLTTEESLEENLRWNEENTVVQAAVECCEEICPALSKPASVLTSLFCLFTQQKEDFLPSFCPDFDPKIAVLFDYFSNIHFGVDKSSLRRIRSLPLFRNIDGKLCSLEGKTVYVWPSNVCQDDCDKWIEKNTGAVFLKRGGVWTQLGPADVLGAQEIYSLTVYTEYIFPHFSLLDENQRLKHLQHIRDNLFDDAKNDSNSKNRRFIALQFISALEELPCLPQDGSLKPISEFADHTVQVFTTFTEYFHFLPENLREDKWLKFFRKVGLHAKVTHDEFLRFCQRVSCGSHRDLAQASTVLLSYLFDCGIKVTDKEAKKEAKKWYENKVFLRKVSQIPFVCTTTLPALSWIKSPYPAENPIQQGLDMTKLNGAVSSEVCYILYKYYYLVWTVRSVVDLPTLPYFIFPNTSDSEAFYNALGIVRSPAIGDVIQNIKNISQTRFSSFSLFDKYPEECKFGDSSEMTPRLLVEVMKANFGFIKNSICPESTLKQLCDIPCVPVCARGQTRNIRCPVLVKPLQVIANTDEVKGFRPFLNPLPDNFYSVLPGVLSVIGVEQSIHLQNIRAALETIHASVTPLLDPNTQTVVKRLLKKLYHILQSSMEKTTEILASLKPLYLPTAELTLVDSTVLFYCDKTQYKKARPPIDLTSTPCTLFSLLNLEIGFNEKKFCELLPTEIRPCPLSSYCDEVKRYSLAQECSSLAKRLAYSFSLGHDFAEVTYALLRQSNPNEEKLCSRFAESLNKFLQTTEVITVRNLVVDIMLNLTEPKQKIGTAKVDFLLQKNDNSFVLYLDEEANPFRLHSLIESLVATVAEMSGISSSELTELEKAISHPLEAENHEELLQILEGMDVPDIRALEFQSVAFNPSLKPQYGKPIPESWHHRLEQSINNIFRPGEWVGYEEREDHIVFAIVGYRILQDGQSPEDIQLEDQYLIYTREDDEEGRTVSVIDLYKIIHSSGRDLSLATEKQPFDEGDLKAIKIQICEELRHIWKLPEDQRRKAIKRLYLKWHPDKNDHYLATKAFQFLQRQIARLHAGLPLEDPDSEEEEGPPMPPWTHPWDSVARRRGRARQREQNFWNTHGSSAEDFDSEALSPDPQAAKVWIEQAEADLIALEVSLAQIDSERKLCSHVCFMAHEVAERALKAAVYAACGLNPGYLIGHSLSGLVGVLEQERRQQTFGLRKHVCALEGYYLYTRYPNQYFPPKVPADQYTPTQAREAKSNAQAIFDMMKTVVTVDEATSTYKHAEH